MSFQKIIVQWPSTSVFFNNSLFTFGIAIASLVQRFGKIPTNIHGLDRLKLSNNLTTLIVFLDSVSYSVYIEYLIFIELYGAFMQFTLLNVNALVQHFRAKLWNIIMRLRCQANVNFITPLKKQLLWLKSIKFD